MDCPPTGNPCVIVTCDAGVCGTAFVAAGTPTQNQKVGDCHVEQCDGAGNATNAVDDDDVPGDGNACTSDVCTSGAPSNPPLPVDTACNQNGGSVCNGGGACVECTSGAQCATGVCAGNACQAASCADGVENGSETDIDCGGMACLPCASGKTCLTAADCQTASCTGGVCQAPAVVSATPGDAATGVATGATVAVTFSRPMNPATLTAQTAIGPCAGSIQLSTDDFATCLSFAAAAPTMSGGNGVATLAPAPALSYGTTYKLRVTTGAQDQNGNALGAAYTHVTGFTTGAPPPSCIGSVVISQIYGHGGELGATYQNDFIELHNRGKTPVTLTDWAVQFAAGNGLFNQGSILNNTIAPGGYFLIQEGIGIGSYGTFLPVPPDLTNYATVSGGSGKAALITDYQPLGGQCPLDPTIVDFVGWGPLASCWEGDGVDAAAAPSPTKSLFRLDDGCTDTQNNAADFVVATVAPRSSYATPPKICSCGSEDATVNESDLPAEIDSCVLQSPFSLTVTAGQTTPLVHGRAYEAGITNPAGANAKVQAQVGYGPAHINPTTQSGWQWFSATFTQQYGDDDEYQGTFTAPAAGSYRYTYRVSLDGGRWTYCDLNGAGSNAGLTFDPAELPVLTVAP